MRLAPTVETAFRLRARGEASCAQAGAFVRSIEVGGLHLAAIANAFDSGWGLTWPAGSSLALELIVDEVTSGTRGLVQGIRSTRDRFLERAPSLPRDPDFPDAPVRATISAFALEGARVDVAWLGGDVAYLVRDGAIALETTPHTKHFVFDGSGTHGRELLLLERSISVDDDGEPSHVSFEARAGDTLVLLGRAIVGPPLSSAAVARVARASNASRVAQDAVGLICEFEHWVYGAAAVVRFDAAQ